MQCRRSDALRRLVNASGMNTPDGMPLVWLSRMAGYPDVTRVYGPDLMLAEMEQGQAAGHRHYFYGGGPDVASRLAQRMRERFPGLRIAGTHTPPFKPVDELSGDDTVELINRAEPDIVWVGISTPKQELWMALHNFLIMVLLAQRTPAPVVRIVQSWKEGLLLLLSLMAAAAFIRAWRAGHLPRPNLFDLLVAVFAGVAVIYTVLPPSLLHGSANLQQRVIGLRVLLLLPLLYLFGRVFQPRSRADLRWVAWAILGSAAAVGLFGLWELWLVPTPDWFGWGVNQLSAWLGFVYNGPKGLPANFFQTTADGLLLRRMVSTYVSPLGIAYAGLVVVPLAVALILALKQARKRWLAAALLILLLAGILFSLTRLALLMTVAEFLMLAVLTRRRWVLYATPVVAGLAMFMIFQYVYVGPLMNRNLVPVAQRPTHLNISSVADPSLTEHAGQLGYDLQYVVQHPLGGGVGSSVHRYGPSSGRGDGAVFDMV